MFKIGGITMENISQMSMLEVAIKVVSDNEGALAINEIIDKVLSLKGIDDPKGEKRAQLYVDITTSSKFVYMGDNAWDLKLRQSLDEYDKDGAEFNDLDDDEEDGASVDDYNVDDDEVNSSKSDEEDEDADDSESYDDEDYDGKNPYADDDDMESDDTDESEFDDIRDTPDGDDFDEDKYGDIMDNYEDLYDK